MNGSDALQLQFSISNAEYRERMSDHVHPASIVKISTRNREEFASPFWQRERIKVRDWTITAPAAQTRSPARCCRVPTTPHLSPLPASGARRRSISSVASSVAEARRAGWLDQFDCWKIKAIPLDIPRRELPTHQLRVRADEKIGQRHTRRFTSA